MLDENLIGNIFGKLKVAIVGYKEAAEAKLTAKEKLEQAMALKMALKQVPGSNADDRKANLAEMFKDEVQQLAALESNERMAKLALDIANADVRELNARLRLLEIQARVTNSLPDENTEEATQD